MTNDLHNAIRTIGREVFGTANEASIETLIADLETTEQAMNRLHDLMVMWKRNQSPETDIATLAPTEAPSGNPQDILSPGMYREPGRAAIFKVQLSANGRLYAKELSDGHFDYSRGAIFRIKPEWRMTRDECQQWGVDTGNCIVCQRELTVPESIARGMGPICYGKFA